MQSWGGGRQRGAPREFRSRPGRGNPEAWEQEKTAPGGARPTQALAATGQPTTEPRPTASSRGWADGWGSFLWEEGRSAEAEGRCRGQQKWGPVSWEGALRVLPAGPELEQDRKWAAVRCRSSGQIGGLWQARLQLRCVTGPPQTATRRPARLPRAASWDV